MVHVLNPQRNTDRDHHLKKKVFILVKGLLHSVIHWIALVAVAFMRSAKRAAKWDMNLQ